MNGHTYPLFYIDFEYLNINIQFIVLFCFFLIYISILLSQSHMKLKWLNILFGPESDLQNKIKNLFNSIIKKKKKL
jgi:hypothetical protein